MPNLCGSPKRTRLGMANLLGEVACGEVLPGYLPKGASAPCVDGRFQGPPAAASPPGGLAAEHPLPHHGLWPGFPHRLAASANGCTPRVSSTFGSMALPVGRQVTRFWNTPPVRHASGACETAFPPLSAGNT